MKLCPGADRRPVGCFDDDATVVKLATKFGIQGVSGCSMVADFGYCSDPEYSEYTAKVRKHQTLRYGFFGGLFEGGLGKAVLLEKM